MAAFDLPQVPQSRVSPALLVGAASPLWAYFGAAAAGGLAYWWMTQWARPVNLEAMFAQAKAAPTAAFEPAVEAAEAVVEVVADTQAAVAEAVLEAAPLAVGGEAAPVSPLLEAAPILQSEPIAEPEAIFAVAPEPVIDEPAPVAPRARKAAPPLPEIDA